MVAVSAVRRVSSVERARVVFGGCLPDEGGFLYWRKYDHLTTEATSPLRVCMLAIVHGPPGDSLNVHSARC